ncbi:MAG TPA: caspase family protein [Allosphingosinicella sp.]|jgi:hypothetical protein
MLAAVKRALIAASALAAIAAAGPAAVAGGGAQPGGASHALRLGDVRTGALESSDERLSSGEFADEYRFTGRRGQRVAIDLGSEAFDTYAILIRPDGTQVDNDDRGEGETTDSHIETALPTDGEYRILVTSFRPGESGRYRLDVRESAGTARQAAVQPGRRVFALFVGVSDYGGRLNELPDTDNDAKGLAEQLDRAGVLHGESVILTNRDATRAAVEAALARIAARAGPEDTFLFFFSGHGDRVKAMPEAGELDGESETIELADGGLTDRDLARMLGAMRTRLSVVALDSCFSGGFDNVVSRPNVMGLFSSDEDLTSQVASEHNAGGYLSHFLRAGFSGEADMDGDAMLTAGELGAYLQRAFREQGEIPATTRDGVQNYQNLVVERGGVRVDDVIFRLAGEARMQLAGGK